MKHLNQTEELNNRIVLLKQKQDFQFNLLRAQFYITYESLKPINLIKGTWKEVMSAPNLKKDLLGSLIGLGTGFLSKKILFGATHNPIKALLGTVLQFGVSNVVSKNSSSIKTFGENLLHRLFSKKPVQSVDN